MPVSIGATQGLEDSSNPYYLHHAENPGQVLVSQMLTGDNYPSWSRSMTLALFAKNKQGFIDGSIPEPHDADPVIQSSWNRSNAIVVSWILNSVSEEISASIIYMTSAREIWQDLKDRFEPSKGPKMFQLGRELMNLRQDRSSVSTYFTKLKAIWEELNHYRPTHSCTCGGMRNILDYHAVEYVMSFLMGLDDSYSQIRTQILLTNPIPSINRVFSLIIQEEQQRQSATTNDVNTGTIAYAVRTGTIRRGSHESSYRNSNFNTSGTHTNISRKDRPFCTHCKLTGHVVDKCYKLHGYPPGYKSRDNHHSVVGFHLRNQHSQYIEQLQTACQVNGKSRCQPQSK